ncbi:hypothetical protein BOTBODRAFT_172186 [Botryobasidium botryosum FD-172 SS1]|uniref:CN hydrolase domain-containing protein n=1 Tax=Botryobasidium botryosum (strain FD-172 SS1) TaxID=930990 RepID=A0A067N1W1_BOTB1|nr:hypothetical protein BOTBODRAFT_172186 [Botryobasidium botryosum FD-172 SS1]
MIASDDSFVSTHANSLLRVATVGLAFLALSPSPSFIPLVLLLGTLALRARVIGIKSLSSSWVSQYIAQLFPLSLGAAASHATPSISALSSPINSLALLSCVCLGSAAAALLPVYLHVKLRSDSNIWMRLTLLPALWATTWVVVSRVSPLGRLGSWSPLTGTEPYDPIRAYLGFPGLDWIVGAWAVVGAELAELAWQEERCTQTPENEHPLVPISREVDQSLESLARLRGPLKKGLFALTALLLAATLPSFTSPLPLAPHSSNTSPLAVACILPPPATKESELDRYLSETKRHAARAKILLWPEGAVCFGNESERTHALAQVGVVTKQYGVWIGATFDEIAPEVDGPIGGPGSRRVGMALIGPDGQLDMEYYKRHLVPLTEPFANVGSKVNPPVYDLPLPPPPHVKAPEWANPPNFTRPIPLTALICLDASKEVPTLRAPPALILAPARTWHPAAGYAMFQLARARAIELDAKVLWCDGGHGAVGGVVGDGEREMQVGEGTWVKTVGIPWPSRHSFTAHAAVGDIGAIFILWLFLTGVGSSVEYLAKTSIDLTWVVVVLHEALRWIQDSVGQLRLPRPVRPDERSSLLDDNDN